MLDEAGNETGDVWGWHVLVERGHVEYVDTEEEETTLIAMTMRDLELQRDAVRRGAARPLLSCASSCMALHAVFPLPLCSTPLGAAAAAAAPRWHACVATAISC